MFFKDILRNSFQETRVLWTMTRFPAFKNEQEHRKMYITQQEYIHVCFLRSMNLKGFKYNIEFVIFKVLR